MTQRIERIARILLPGFLALAALHLACGNSVDHPSEAGAEWSRRKGPDWTLSGIAWSGQSFVAVGSGALTSPDGVVWTPHPLPGSWVLRSVTWGRAGFVAIGWSHPREGRLVIATSTDGAMWTEQKVPEKADVRDVASSGDMFVAVGESILSSQDGIIWTARNKPVNGRLNSVTWANSEFIAVGYEHVRDAENSCPSIVVASPDGVTWSERSVPRACLKAVAWSDRQLVAVGDSILTSPDGRTWTRQTAPTRKISLNSVTWGGSRFVAVGQEPREYHAVGLILTSPDGLTWTRSATPTRADFQDVAWSGSGFAAVGILHRGFIAHHVDGLIMTSP